MKKSRLILAICCIGFAACETVSRTLMPNLQVKWPSSKVPENHLVLDEGSILTIELKTNLERVEAFVEGQKTALSLNYITTIQRLKTSEYSIGLPGIRRIPPTMPAAENEETKLFDLTMPALSSFGIKELSLGMGQNNWERGNIVRTIEILYEPERLEELARLFIRNWWCRNGKSLRFAGNTIRWRNEVPGLNPYIQKTTNILSRWWSKSISFVEDPHNPDVIIRLGEKFLASVSANIDAHIIVGGTIFVPVRVFNLSEDAILLCVAHEFGHCLGIAVDISDHPVDNSFMEKGENASLRCHPYQQRAAYWVYTHPAGTKF